MSDEPKQPAENAPDGAEQGSANEAPEMFPAEYVKQLREEAKTYRLQVKEMQTRMSQFEQAQAQAEEQTMAEQSRWKELAEKREKELAELKASLETERMTALRSRIASEFSLPPQLAERLTGSNEEELRADAQGLSELIPKPSQPQASRQTTQVPAGESSTNREEWLKQWIYGRKSASDGNQTDTDGKTYWRFGPNS